MGFLFVASFAAIEAGIVSIYGHEGIEGGIVLAVFAGGSLIGGLLFAHRALAPWSLVIRMTTIVAGTALCLVSLDMRWLCLVLLFGGLGTAPTFASLSALISSTLPSFLKPRKHSAGRSPVSSWAPQPDLLPPA